MKRNKKIIVESLDWVSEVTIDPNIFDDVFMEAATRVIEENKDVPEFEVAVTIECYEKKNINKPEKHHSYNVYFVLVNAGLYEKAEMLRLNFLKHHQIDLKLESVSDGN